MKLRKMNKKKYSNCNSNNRLSPQTSHNCSSLSNHSNCSSNSLSKINKPIAIHKEELKMIHKISEIRSLKPKEKNPV